MLKPLNKNVYARRIDQEVKSESGLYLGQIKSDIETAQVLASASDLIKVGDKIVFNKYAVTKVDDSSLIIKEDNILGTC